jgi:flagellar hook-basal body complex protein FliE
MVDRIKSSLAREAILAALRDQTEAAKAVRTEARQLFESTLEGSAAGRDVTRAASAPETRGPRSLLEGVRAIDGEVRGADPDRMAKDLLSGEIQGFHEVAARINRARISFEFAMEVRNKLIDAYRETMRMTL